MTTIVTRAGKGSPLTHTEVDTNFTNLNTNKFETAAIPLGTAAAPSISFVGRANTGIYSPAADTLAFVTAGGNRVHITSAGLVGIGTSSPGALLDVREQANAVSQQIRLTNTNTVGTVGSAIKFQGFYDTALISSDGVPGATTGGSLRLQTYSSNGVLNTGINVDRLGNVGIGTTTSGFTNNLIIGSGTGDNGATIYAGTASSSILHFADGSSGADRYRGGIVYNHANNSFNFATNDTSAVTIDSSQRLLVGTSSSFSAGASAQYGKFQVVGNSFSASTQGIVAIGRGQAAGASITSGSAIGTLVFSDSTGGEFAQIACEADAATGTNDYPGRLVFSTTPDGGSSPMERMRITSGGNVMVNTANPIISTGRALQVYGSTLTAAVFKTDTAATESVNIWNSATSGNNVFLEFDTETSITSRGIIDYNRAAGQVRYNVTSDRRLKSDVQPASTALGVLSAIQVRSYKWAETGYQVDHGFIAQELNEVAPDAVKVGDDGEEVTDTWAVDNGKLVPLLTKALQEAIAKIETLEARLAAAGIE